MNIEAFRSIANTNTAHVTLGNDDQLTVHQGKVSLGDKLGRAFRVSSSKVNIQENCKVRHQLAMSLGSALGISTKDYGALLQTLQKTLGKNVFNADYFKESGLKSGRPLSSRRITQIVNAMDTVKAQKAEEVSDILSGIGADSIRDENDYDIEGDADDALFEFNEAVKKADIVKGKLGDFKSLSDLQSEKSVEMVQLSGKGNAAPKLEKPVISEELQKSLDECIDQLLAGGKVERNATKQLEKEINGMSDVQKAWLWANMGTKVKSASDKLKACEACLRSVRLSPETSALLMKKLATKPMPNLMNQFAGGVRETEIVDDIGRDNKAWYEKNGYTIEESDNYTIDAFGERKKMKLKAPQEMKLKWVKDKDGNDIEMHKLKSVKLKGHKHLGILTGDNIGGTLKTLAKKDYRKVDANAIPLPNGADIPAMVDVDVLDMIKMLEDAIDETKLEVDNETKPALDKLKDYLNTICDELADHHKHGRDWLACISDEMKMDIGRIYATFQAAGCQPAEQV